MTLMYSFAVSSLFTGFAVCINGTGAFRESFFLVLCVAKVTSCCSSALIVTAIRNQPEPSSTDPCSPSDPEKAIHSFDTEMVMK
ncbi:hypothetical protein F4777DRAFT_541420 [Nemania sp. FL0916]|nr:hypothetical protein F4777DRAFT_541420 [Nemania sp. FL0916]